MNTHIKIVKSNKFRYVLYNINKFSVQTVGSDLHCPIKYSEKLF